ncbi:hypothetical protein [Candidatus Laterigemmans baculatus]|nr:hypothetical protein [Candidatus Laterigemmans baculatus]
MSRPSAGERREQLIFPLERPPDTDAPIEITERLGGTLRSYRRAA